MACPRGYRQTIAECKAWALKTCRGISNNEAHWLKSKRRTRRQAWASHTGGLGVFKFLYETFSGKKIETNHVVGLKTILKDITKAMTLQRKVAQTINRKVVCLLKLSDTLTAKLNLVRHHVPPKNCILRWYENGTRHLSRTNKNYITHLLN